MVTSPMTRAGALGRAVAAGALMAGLCAVPNPAHALFHLAHMTEIMTSYNGDPNVQFVEITMTSVSENFINGVRLNTFDAN